MLERLASAIVRESEKEVKRLIKKKGADLDAVLSGGAHTPLTLATTAGNFNIVETLLDAGADPLVRWSGDCPIHAACQFGHASIVTLLIERGVSVELESEDKCRPLFIAAQNGFAEVTKVLIAAGVDLEFRYEGAFTALYMAAQCGHADVLAELLKAGAYTGPQGRNGFTPLIQSSHRGHLPVVKALLRHGCPPSTKNHQGCTALHLAASANQVTVMMTLMDFGADPDESGPDGFDAMSLARQGGHSAAVLLLERVKERPRTPPLGATPLHLSVMANDFLGIRDLLRGGTSPEVKNQVGCTPLHTAVVNVSAKGVNALLQGGAEASCLLHWTGAGGVTPLAFTHMCIAASEAGITRGQDEALRHVRDALLRAGAFRRAWVWPVPQALQEGGEEEGGGGEAKGGPSEAMKAVKLQRMGQLEGQQVVLRAITRYVSKGMSGEDFTG